jgi:predicted nucleotidyltransferase component of viral defense system
MNLNFDILDKKRMSILPKLALFKRDFYLAGGTALTLCFGHRDSIDFDFFTQKPFIEDELISKIEETFKSNDILIVQKDKGTVTAIIDDEIKISFFHYDYNLVGKIYESDFLGLASIEDIACMKLSAICSRSLYKDYLDLFFIFKDFGLAQLLELCKKKFVHLDEQVILKSLVYFEDIEMEPVILKNSREVTLLEIEKDFVFRVKEYLRQGK